MDPLRAMRRLLSALLLVLVVAPASAERVPGTQFERLEATDSLGRTITYYLSDSETPKPLALMIQGSGCSALFRRLADGAMSAVGYHNVLRGAPPPRPRRAPPPTAVRWRFSCNTGSRGGRSP